MKKDDFNYILGILKKYAGWDLGEDKFFILDRKIYNFVREKGYATVEDLIAELRLGHKNLLWQVIEALTLSDTSFYRDYGVFQNFENHILPHIREANRGSKKLRIWSLGCSSGQETYSIAMAIRNKLKGVSDWDIKIIGTDLSTPSIAKAQKGIYSSFEVQMGLNARMIIDNFQQQENNQWQIRRELMNMVMFRRHNMLDEMIFPESFDIIFCRNVLRFFSEEAQQLMMNRIYHNQISGGFLYLGLGEKIAGMEEYYEPVNGMKCLYQGRIGIERRRSENVVKQASAGTDSEMPSFVRPDNLRPLASGPVRRVDPRGYDNK